MDGKSTAAAGRTRSRAGKAERAQPAVLVSVQKLALVIATALAAINVWTGAPLFALWVGSRVQGTDGLSMTAVFAVVAVLALLVTALAWALTRLSAKYDELTGRPHAARHTSPWLRSMRDERDSHVKRKHRISAIEKVVVATVVAAVLAFEIWFFFFAGSSLPHS
jgi:hypothetical protein